MNWNALKTLVVAIALVPSALAHGWGDSGGQRGSEVVKFESMAPKGSALVIVAHNLNATTARFESGPLGQLMVAPEIESVGAPVRKESARKRAEQLQALGIEVESVPWPGPMGIAVFVEHNEELDAPEIGLLAWADYEVRADAAGKVFDGLIRDLEKDAGHPFEQVEVHGGAKATRVELPAEPSTDDPQDPQPPRRRPPSGIDALGSVTAMPEALYFIRVGSQFFAASNVATLEDAIAVSSGKVAASVADSDDWRGMATLIGESDVSITLVIAPLAEVMAPLFAGPMESVKGILSQLFGDVRAVSLAVRGADQQNIVDASLAIYIPGEKSGLMDLLSESTPIEAPAAILGDEAITYQRLNVRFGQIMAMLEGIISTLPEFQADAIAPMLEQYALGLTKAFACLGPAISTVSRKAPGGTDGTRSITAIRCTDEKATNALLATILPQAGLMPRDFQGQVVYGGDGMEMEFGLGGGALVIGEAESVEQALRSSTDASLKSLGEDPIYRKAVSSIAPGSVVGWGYTDMPTMLDMSRKDILAMNEQVPEEFVADGAAADGEENGLGILIPAQFDPALEPALEKLDHTVLSRYLGPAVWDVRSVSKGMKVRFQWLTAVPSVQPTLVK